jgi:hypothetical protein
MIQHRTGFDPLRHGFAFTNSFDWRWPWEPPSRRRTIGLCGGMCYVALDNFRARQPVPDSAFVPEQGSVLYRRLFWRQVASMAVPFAMPRLLRALWQSDARVAVLTRIEAAGLQALLSEGPQVLMLVVTRRWEQPTENHQVLAWGYDWDPSTETLDVAVYDPNFPCEPVWLSLDMKPGAGPPIHSRGVSLRGFFVQRYWPGRPLRLGTEPH